MKFTDASTPVNLTLFPLFRVYPNAVDIFETLIFRLNKFLTTKENISETPQNIKLGKNFLSNNQAQATKAKKDK